MAGDIVKCEESMQGDESSIRITEIVERSSLLARPDRRGQLKALAANVTRLLIVMASKPVPEALLIDQFCITALRAGIEPVIVWNKIDRVSDGIDADTGIEREAIEGLLDDYRAAGFEVVSASVKTDDGLQRLRSAIAGHTSVLVGQSGVGKSSIVKCLLPDQEIRIGAVSSATGIGAHTTTVSFWYELENDGAMIDSPGVRQFLVDHLTPAEVESGYPEIMAAATDCRFKDCHHNAEPDCAVQSALAENRLSKRRYKNYLKLSQLSAEQ